MAEVIPIEEAKKETSASPEFIVLKFADSKVPVFKEARNKGWIKYGEDNLYPDYLTFLFNKSAKHNAIVTGKAKYIFGAGYENGDMIVNRFNESLNDVVKKAILDVEIYGGFRWELVYNYLGQIAGIYHVDYPSIRKGKSGGYYFKETWDINNRDEERLIPAFNPSKPEGSQIYAYDEYRPGVKYYPLPGYIGSNNFIETDIEVSKYYLSCIRNGMMPSKMIQFFVGEPTDDKKRTIEKKLKDKFAGAENAGQFFLVFNQANAQKGVEVSDLSASELDKHMIELNKTCSQEIFSGHLVTSPALFGIKTEGQLGATNELKTAYEIFINTYAKPKAEAIDKEIEWLMSYSMWKGEYELRQTDPIGLQFDVKDVLDQIPTEFIFEKLGIPKEMWGNIQPLQPALPKSTTPITPLETSAVNEHIKNLTGRQRQQILSLVEKYKNGKLTELAVKALLRTGYGLDNEAMNDLLGIENVAAAKFETTVDEVIAMFDACGEDKEDFEILKTKRVTFSSNEEITAHEEAFKKFDPSPKEKQILDAVKNNEKVSIKELSGLTKTTETYVNRKIQQLIDEGILEGEIGRLLVPPPIADLTDKKQKEPVQIFVKYSYDWRPEVPAGERNTPSHPSRPFCVKMMSLNRLYSRYDIEQISERLGYSVFDRNGGFWNNNGTIENHCRHTWTSHVVVKKGGSK